MNLFSIAVFFLRLTGFSFLVDGTINLTYLPESLAAAGSAKGAFVDLHEFDAVMIVVRVMLLTLVGLVFLVFSRPLSKLFTRGLSSVSAEQPANENTWPPAPNKSSAEPRSAD